jgi:hypothetical protein
MDIAQADYSFRTTDGYFFVIRKISEISPTAETEFVCNHLFIPKNPMLPIAYSLSAGYVKRMTKVYQFCHSIRETQEQGMLIWMIFSSRTLPCKREGNIICGNYLAR